MPSLDDLLQMLTYRRPAGSRSLNQFTRKYIDSIPGIERDGYGNRILACANTRTMIACHLDTVHRMAGSLAIQHMRNGLVRLHPREKVSNCLGADDTAGVFACLSMIEAGVKATFVFHQDEEIGGLGSAWIARNRPDFLAGFDHCISLDRRGTRDIITSQWGAECCSGQFASELANALDMGHKPARGTFTDSANYVDIIPECSNLSVGYYNEHTRAETLDTRYLMELIPRLCAVDWSQLPTARAPRARASLEAGYLPSYWLDDWDEVKDEEDTLDVYKDDPWNDFRFARRS